MSRPRRRSRCLDDPQIGTDGGGQARGRAPQARPSRAEERSGYALLYAVACLKLYFKTYLYVKTFLLFLL